MTEKSLILPGGAEMIRAVLDGRKSRFTAPMNPQPRVDDKGHFLWNGRNFGVDVYGKPVTENFVKFYCPYGRVGDRLWVREAWKTGNTLDPKSPRQIAKAAEEVGYEPGCPILYVADNHHARWSDHDVRDFGEWGKVRSPMHMPRWASRITLEIVSVKVHQLYEITEDEAKAEGVPPALRPPQIDELERRTGGTWMPFLTEFRGIWEDIHGTDSWEAIPWVWAVEFRRVF